MAHKSPMLHSIYDLTTFCRKTTGDVPPNLIGASTTVFGSKMYLFGGRLVSERRIVANLYVFDMDTFVWEEILNLPEEFVPPPRYFHSSDTWNDHLIIFGGMSNRSDASTDELCVLNDIHFFNFTTRRWLPPVDTPNPELVPRARYAHLSSVTGDRLVIIGGQDFHNAWLDDICHFNLLTQTWTQQQYPRHCGTYRSVAVSSPTVIRTPHTEVRPTSTLGLPGKRFPSRSIPGPPPETTPSENLIHLPYLAVPTEDHPSEIYLYSNYNFTDVKRELEVFTPLPNGEFTVHDRSPTMTGSTFPPGLRFPTGALLGTHLIIAGTYLAHSYQSFSIWALDLTSMAWSRIDPGKAIETGSWFRGCLYAAANKFLIFGNRHGNLVDDYNRRLLSWGHVAIVDLEAFGIYQPPPLKLNLHMQELGLAALEERVLTDFEIVCEDGQRIPCSRRLLEERWDWFGVERKLFLEKAIQASEALPTSPMHTPLPELPGDSTTRKPRVDPRLTPRALYLSEPYPIALAFLQYIYSLALITSLQHTSGVLGQLLILATNYRISHLESLVKHAMHQALTNQNSVGVYEVTTLCSCRSLQIRALKTVMAYTQKRPSRKADKEARDGSQPSNNVGDRGSNDSTSKYVSRPRGTSDAAWGILADQSGISSPNHNYQSNQYMPIKSSKKLAVGSTGSPLADSSLRSNPTITTGALNIDRVSSSQPSVSPSVIPAYALSSSSFLPSPLSASNSSTSPSKVALTPGLTVNTSTSPSSRSQTGKNLSTKRSGSPNGFFSPMFPHLLQRPDGHLPLAVVPQSSSSEDIQSGLRNRNNRSIDRGRNRHTKQSSTSSNQRNQPPKIKDKSITSNSLSSPPTVPFDDQRPFSENITFPLSQLPSEKTVMVQEAVRDDANNSTEQKPVHWPKHAPTVHWITSEGSNFQSPNPAGNVLTADSSKP